MKTIMNPPEDLYDDLVDKIGELLLVHPRHICAIHIEHWLMCG